MVVRTPESTALQMALRPNLASLDELLAAIRALQCQADQEMNRLLEQNKELLAALKGLRALILGECASVYECVDGERADAAIAKAQPQRNTRTDTDVADDARAIREEAGL